MPKKSSKLVFFWHPLRLTWGATCRAFSLQMSCQDVLVSHLAAKGFKSTVFGCFWHSWGTSKACNCYRFLRFDSASSGPKAIAHFALMHLRQQKIATYSVSATSVLAVHRLAMPCSHRINMEFQNSDQRCSLCTPCICDCCRMGVKITTCMDMHGSALVYMGMRFLFV